MTLQRRGYAKLNERYFRESANEYAVYVEGDKDILFWEDIFPVFAGKVPRVQVLLKEDKQVIGGWNNLIGYLDSEIERKSKINFIIAIDGDYNAIIHHKKIYKNVVITKKYNIENYIFCPVSINNCMKLLSFGAFNNLSYVKDRFNKFSNLLKNIIIVDCINEKYGYGYQIYNIDKSELVSFIGIKKFVKSIEMKYKDIISDNSTLLDGVDIVDYIKWKPFLTKLLKVIQEEVCESIKYENAKRNNNFIRKLCCYRSEEDLYIYCLKNCRVCNEKCPDYIDLKNQAIAALKSII